MNDYHNKYTTLTCVASLGQLTSMWYGIEEPVLDSVEKRYLKSIIWPISIRLKIRSVRKVRHCDDLMRTEYLAFRMKDSFDTMILPNFPEGTMYKGMEAERDYTLEELGL